MKTGIEMIAAERERKITTEGWSAAYDDTHQNAEMIHAARCYVGHALGLEYGMERQPRTPVEWPWDSSRWKPSTDPVRDLAKAGALIAAEIDRLSRRNTDVTPRPVFDLDILTRSILNEKAAEIFRAESKQVILRDDITDALVVCYRHPDGRVLLDAVRLPNYL